MPVLNRMTRVDSTLPGSSGAGFWPALAVAAATLAVVVGTLALATVAGRPVGEETLLHLAVLGALAVVAWISSRVIHGERAALVAAVAVIGVMFFLYSSLGRVAFVAIPWGGDGWLRYADRLLGLGREPTVLISDALAGHYWAVEFLSAFYWAFIPYLYLTIFLSLVGRPPQARRVFVLAFALLYGASFMGYLFVPARGPVVAMAGSFRDALEGGFFLRLVVGSIDAMGGPHGAFPSLHVGASVLAMTFDLRHGDRLRGLVYVPLVLLIALATIVLRYHYVVDLLTGGALGLVALAIARRWYGVGTRAREGA